METVRLERTLTPYPIATWGPTGNFLGHHGTLPAALRHGAAFIRKLHEKDQPVYRVVGEDLVEVKPHWVFELGRKKR